MTRPDSTNHLQGMFSAALSHDDNRVSSNLVRDLENGPFLTKSTASEANGGQL